MLYIHLQFSMLTPFISSFRIEFTIILAATIATGMSYYQECSYSLTTNNNEARIHSWNRPTAPGTPSGMDLDGVGGNRSKSSTPHGMIHYEFEPSVNNLTSAGNPSGMNLSNGLPTLGNPTSVNQTETDNKMCQSNTHCTSYNQRCSYSSATNNNTSRGLSLNRRTTSGTPLGMDLVEVCRNRLQSGTPHVMSQSERTPSGNNLSSADNPSGMNLLNGLPMFGNPPSKKQEQAEEDEGTHHQKYYQ